MFTTRSRKLNATKILLVAFIPIGSMVGCGIFPCGCFGPGTAPTVIFTNPDNKASGVALNQKIAATFSQGMDGPSLDVAYTVTGPGATPVAGTITYDVPSNVVTFTPAVLLAINSTYTAMLTTDAQNLAGVGLESDFIWTFRTGVTVDTTRPTVILTHPEDGETDVAINRKITATFSEAMDPSTINAARFTLTDSGETPIAGTVTYAAVGNTAIFTPTSFLPVNTTFTAMIGSTVQDLAGNGLVSDFMWSFTTGATAADTTAPTVILTSPVNMATGVPLNKRINATFSEAMDPSTISTVSFIVTGPGTTPVKGTVSYNAATHIATFVPLNTLAPNTTFAARITTAVRDLSDNALASTFIWSFTTSEILAEEPVDLNSLSTFAVVAGAGLTNSNSGGQTTINWDVGLSPTGTCLGDGSPCSATNPLINGTLYANDPGGVAAAAKADLTLAFNDATGRPPGTTVNDLSGMVLPPGVYTSGSTMSIAVGGTLTLDAQGDANAVWIFQIGSSLTVNNNAQVLLINGAKAANVFWAAAASSTIGTNVSFKGNVFAGESNSLETGSTVEGRMLCTTGAITLLSNTITLPAP
jgi:hypothetical protein